VFDVVGPIPEGRVIESLTLAWWTPNGGSLTFAASMGSSNEATQVALEAGTSLLTASTSIAFAIPSLGWLNVGGEENSIEIPVGVRVDRGSQWIVFASNGTMISYGLMCAKMVEEEPVHKAVLVNPGGLAGS
jgi:hypothetical protein